MKRLTGTIAVLAFTVAPAFGETGENSAEEGFSLLEEGAKIILRSMLDEVEPSLKELNREFGEAMREMEPAMRDLFGMIGDIRHYHAPEMLPNGDIIIRRKSPAEQIAPGPDGEIET